MWFWGLGGAFMWAGPRLCAGLYKARKGEAEPRWLCLLIFIVCLAIGAFAAEAFAPWLSAFLKLSDDRAIRGVSAFLGLIANKAAPGVADALSVGIVSISETVLKKLSTGSKE